MCSRGRAPSRRRKEVWAEPKLVHNGRTVVADARDTDRYSRAHRGAGETGSSRIVVDRVVRRARLGCRCCDGGAGPTRPQPDHLARPSGGRVVGRRACARVGEWRACLVRAGRSPSSSSRPLPALGRLLDVRANDILAARIARRLRRSAFLGLGPAASSARSSAVCNARAYTLEMISCAPPPVASPASAT